MAPGITNILSSMETINTRVLVYAVGALIFLIAWLLRKNRRVNLPDGPRGVPFFGSMFSLNDGKLLHLKLTEWAHKYGDVYSYMMGRSPVIVLNSPQAINDLFVKRGN